MVNNLPEWNNEGIEPPNSLKNTGWQEQDRPPAPYFNWYMNRTYLALVAAKEHIENRANPHNVTKNQVGLGNVTNDLQATKTEFDTHVNAPSHTFYGVATGTNTLALAISSITSLVAGLAVRFKNPNANTGAVTLNINGYGAKPVIRANGTALNAGALRIGGVYTVCYDGTNFFLQGEGGEYGTAASADVVAGKTIGTENGIVQGTIPSINGGSQTLNAGQSYTIPYGVHNGQGTISAASLASQTAANILAEYMLIGKTAWVNGVRLTGTLPDYSAYRNTVAAGQTLNLPTGYYKNGQITGVPLSTQTQATAIAAKILQGETAWVNGNKITGTMRNYSRAAMGNYYSDALSVKVDAEGTLVVEPRTGYYESGLNAEGWGTIMAKEPNLIPANIVAGKRIFNVVGTANPTTLDGLRMAKGTYRTTNNGLISVSGLSFRPRLIVVHATDVSRWAGVVYAENGLFQTPPMNHLSLSMASYENLAAESNVVITNDGFHSLDTRRYAPFNHEWIALG